MAMTIEQFRQQIVQTGLLTDAEVAACIENCDPDRRPSNVESLANELVRAGKLTKFQAAAIYQGKSKGLVLGDYLVLDKLGQGGMGMVLKAQHRRMKRLVAIKVLTTANRTPPAIKRFYQEVVTAAQLNHPNIVTAYDSGEHEGILYLVMEYVDGKDLGTLVKHRGPMATKGALNCVLQAARGLQYAHGKGVVHRDIKPGNLLLDSEGNIKILDMGLARSLIPVPGELPDAQRLTQPGQVMGTGEYMAPEQAADPRSADHLADIYALGCTLCRLLTGRPPLRGRNARRHADGAPRFTHSLALRCGAQPSARRQHHLPEDGRQTAARPVPVDGRRSCRPGGVPGGPHAQHRLCRPFAAPLAAKTRSRSSFGRYETSTVSGRCPSSRERPFPGLQPVNHGRNATQPERADRRSGHGNSPSTCPPTLACRRGRPGYVVGDDCWHSLLGACTHKLTHTPGVPQPPCATRPAGDCCFAAKEVTVSRVQKPAFDPYDVLEQLSGSRTGSVFKARHQTTGRIVALKVLSHDILNSPQYVERFRRKAQILSKINHPNIVRAIDTGQRDGVPYLVMEFIDGTDLRSIIKQRTLLTVRQTVDYIIQAATGLGALHAMGICHRNIKPSNLLVDSRGTVRIVGMGMAHVENGADLDVEDIRLTMPGQVMGTYDFMAPEQAFDSGTVDLRADIYALGCTLYAMLTGKAPYPGKTPLDQVMAHREMPIPSLRTLRADVPESLELVFRKMMAKGPSQRYVNTDQLIADLRTCFNCLKRGEPVASAPSPGPRPVCSPPSRVIESPLPTPPKTETSATVDPRANAAPGPSPLISPFVSPPSTPVSLAAVDQALPPAPPPVPAPVAPSVPPASESLLARRTLPVSPLEMRSFAEESPLTDVEPPKEDLRSRSETPTPSGHLDAPWTSIGKTFDPGPLTWIHEAVIWILLTACVSGLTAVWLLWPAK